MMDEDNARTCMAHIRAAARLCEAEGEIAMWATLLGVADQLLETIDAPMAQED